MNNIKFVRYRFWGGLLAIGAMLAPFRGTGGAASQAGPADLILTRGIVYTVDSRNSIVEAVAIKDGRILAAGTGESVEKYRGASTRMLDLDGRFVVPGFNDNHVHFASAAQFLEFNIMATSTQEEFVRRTREVVANLPKGDWVVGGFWGAYDAWAAGSAGGKARPAFVPEIRDIESFTREHPLFIRKFDDSEYAANRAALVAAGLDPSNPAAPGVEFLRGPDGKFTGIMRGKGVRPLFDKKLPKRFSRARRIRQTLRALEEIRKYGVTNIADISDDEQLEIFRDLQRSGRLTVRVHFRPGLERWREMADRGVRVGSGDDWIRLGALKGHIDGIMGTRTARFFQPYANDPDNRGRWRPLMVDDQGRFVEGKFLGYMLDADRAGLQLTVHAIGDEANHVLLDYLEELERRNGKRDRRFRLVHAQVLAEEDFERLGRLGVVAEVQPFHLSDDMRWMEERIGRARCSGAYAFRRIRDSGAILSFGTDWPGTSAAEYPINPMLGLHAAVTRRTIRGEPKEGWFPDQRIGIEEAIKAYTYNTAYANFEENTKGSIEAGKLADLAVLSRNPLKIPPEEILATQVDFTIVDGKIVYQRSAADPSRSGR